MHLTWRFWGCPALHTDFFFLGISVPIKQAKVARGNLIVPPWNLRKIPLGVYWTSLLAATSRARPRLWSWHPVPTVPSMLGLSCQSLLLARSKDSKKLRKYIHTPITIHRLRYQHPSEGCNVHLHTRVYMHTCMLPPWVHHRIPKHWSASGRMPLKSFP